MSTVREEYEEPYPPAEERGETDRFPPSSAPIYTREEELSPIGLHDEELAAAEIAPVATSATPNDEADSPRRGHGYSDEKKEMVLLALARNGGNMSKTVRETGVTYETVRRWRDESAFASKPDLDKSAKQKLSQARDQVASAIDQITSSLPASIKKATLVEKANAITKLVPLLGEIDMLLAPPQSPADLLEEMRKKIKERQKNSNGNGND